MFKSSYLLIPAKYFKEANSREQILAKCKISQFGKINFCEN